MLLEIGRGFFGILTGATPLGEYDTGYALYPVLGDERATSSPTTRSAASDAATWLKRYIFVADFSTAEIFLTYLRCRSACWRSSSRSRSSLRGSSCKSSVPVEPVASQEPVLCRDRSS